MISTDQILADLTDEQREAVTSVEGPLLIVAGAGSGKTRVITRRVAYLLNLGIEASAILAITFTNKAAGEMKTRIASLMDRPLRDFGRLEQPWPMICTFHSLGLRVLKHFAQAAGLPENFTVYDTSDQEKVVKEAIAAAELSSTNFPPSAVHHVISDAKNKLQTPEAYAAAAHNFPATYYARVYKHYQKALEKNKAVDFDDLLMRTAHALPRPQRCSQAASAAVRVHPHRRVPGHQPRPVCHRACAGAWGIAISAWWAIRTSRSTPGAGQISRTSLISRRIIRMRRW